LSYALCPDDMGRPLFGTVVLDEEAFSKSSQAVAARIIEAMRQVGLHPLFITPNKEMRLLRMHTRSAVGAPTRPTGGYHFLELGGAGPTGPPAAPG